MKPHGKVGMDGKTKMIEVPVSLLESLGVIDEIMYYDERNRWAEGLGFYAPTWYTRKTYLKNVAKWDRIFKKWGQSEAALNELGMDGDDKHGIGFQAYLRSFRSEQNAKKERKKALIEQERQKKEKAKKVSKLMREYHWGKKP